MDYFIPQLFNQNRDIYNTVKTNPGADATGEKIKNCYSEYFIFRGKSLSVGKNPLLQFLLNVQYYIARLISVNENNLKTHF